MCFYCNCEVLTRNKRGEILRNEERTCISVQFGNIDFSLNQRDFIAFFSFINSLTDGHLEEMTNHWNNKIVIRQKAFMGGYCFYPDEFVEFRGLMKEAIEYLNFEEELKKILDPRNNN